MYIIFILKVFLQECVSKQNGIDTKSLFITVSGNVTRLDSSRITSGG